MLQILGEFHMTPHSGLGMTILIAGALFTAAVGVSVVSFYFDDYWEDEDFREQLRVGTRQAKSKKV